VNTSEIASKGSIKVKYIIWESPIFGMKSVFTGLIVASVLLLIAYPTSSQDMIFFDESTDTMQLSSRPPAEYPLSTRNETLIFEFKDFQEAPEGKNWEFIFLQEMNPHQHYSQILSASIRANDTSEAHPCDVTNVHESEENANIVKCTFAPPPWTTGTTHYLFTITINTQINYAAASSAPEEENWDIKVKKPGDENNIFLISDFQYLRFPLKPSVLVNQPPRNGEVIISAPYLLHGQLVEVEPEPEIKKVIINYRLHGESEWQTLVELGVSDNASGEIPGYFEYQLDPLEEEFGNGAYDLNFVGIEGPGESANGIGLVSGEGKLREVIVNISNEIDETPPELSDEQPESGSVISERRPEISIIAHDPESGVDASSIRLTLDSHPPIFSTGLNYEESSGKISYTPDFDLEADDDHTVNIEVKNSHGIGINNGEGFNWRFRIAGQDDPNPPQGPGVQLAAEKTTGEGPLLVHFSYDCVQGDVPLESCKLNFGNGNVVELGTPGESQVIGNIQETYIGREASYKAKLTAIDQRELSATDQVTITSSVPINNPPDANAIKASSFYTQTESLTFNEGEGIKFEADATDPDNTDLNYIWDFGDGEIESLTSNIVYHAYYLEPGVMEKNYTVTLIVSDGKMEDSTSIVIKVKKALMKLKVITPSTDEEEKVKGQNVGVQVEVTDIYNVQMNVSEIIAYFNDTSTTFKLTKEPAGLFYGGSFETQIQTPNVGYIFVIASTEIAGKTETAGTTSQVEFLPAEFTTTIKTDPEIPVVGSVLKKISVRLDYFDGNPVNNATVIGRIEGSDLGNILFSETASGIYEANLDYEVLPKDADGIFLNLKATDEFGNGSKDYIENRIETNPTNPILNTLAVIIAVFFVSGIAFYVWNQWRRDKIRLKKRLLREKTTLEGLLKKLKYEYFKRHLSEAEYKEKILQTEQQLATVEEMLGVERTTKVSMSKGEVSRQKQALMKKIQEVKEQEKKEEKSGIKTTAEVKKPVQETEHKIVTVEGKKKLYIPPHELEQIERELIGTGEFKEGKEGIAAKTHHMLSGILKRESVISVEKRLEAKFSESEREDIKRLVFLLRGKKGKYNRKEMANAVIAEGYTAKIADKVVSILFKDK